MNISNKQIAEYSISNYSVNSVHSLHSIQGISIVLDLTLDFNLQQERKIVEYSRYSTMQANSETKDELFNPS